MKHHEHFCSACYGHGNGRKARGGWWKCGDKKCVQLPSTLCKYHREMLEARGGPAKLVELQPSTPEGSSKGRI